MDYKMGFRKPTAEKAEPDALWTSGLVPKIENVNDDRKQVPLCSSCTSGLNSTKKCIFCIYCIPGAVGNSFIDKYLQRKFT